MTRLDRLALGVVVGWAGVILGWALSPLSAWFLALTIIGGAIGIYSLVEGDAASMRGERADG